MQKPLKDMAKYIKNAIPADIPETYVPKSLYDSVSDSESIRRGVIARGYGCDKKKFGRPCQGGCHGFRIPLDGSVLSISRDIGKWLDAELCCRLKA